jgi:aminoglycoside phosphotransferase (APT) family kinase protein
MMENILTVAQAQKAIEAQNWPNLQVNTIEFLGEGWDNLVFLVNDSLVFRFAKNKEAQQFLMDENKILPCLQNIFDLKIPNPIFFGKPSDSYAYAFHGYKILAGDPFYRVNLSVDQMQNCIVQLAKFLKQLHAIKAVDAKNMGAAVQSYDRSNVEVVLQNLDKRLAVLHKQAVVELDSDFIKNLKAQAAAIVLDHSNDCLVHGDLDMRHLLVLDYKLSGVIDWGEVGINHPVIDLVVLFNMFPTSMHSLFFKEYGQVSHDVYQYAKFLALYRAVTLMMSAHECGDDAMFAIAHRAYQRLKKS